MSGPVLRMGALVLGASAALLAGVGCRKEASNDGATPDAAASATASAAAPPVGDADSAPASEVEPPAPARVSRPDGGAGRATCEGARVALISAALEPACAVDEREWSSVVGAFTGTLRQEARLVHGGVELAIVNAGHAPVVVPVRVQPSHPELAISVLAETDTKAVYELAAPKLDPVVLVAPPRPVDPRTRDVVDASVTSRHVYSARIRLPPGGRASTQLTIDPRPVKRLDRSCLSTGSAVDGGEPCLPGRLPGGHVVLHLGQLVAGVDTGAPARLEWDVPANP